MLAHMAMATVKPWGLWLGCVAVFCLGCEEDKKPTEAAQPKAAQEERTPEPVEQSPPHLVIGEKGPTVRGTAVEGGRKSGVLEESELFKLRAALADERKFIEGATLRLVVDRNAKRGWVGTYLRELDNLGAAKVSIATETRKEFQGEHEFILPSKAKDLPGCVMIGKVTEHNGSALWQVKGGSITERGPGLGGPDLAMAQEVFQKNYKTCESDAFITDGENTKDWGFIFDMAAAAVATQEVSVKRAALLSHPQTPGRSAQLE
jgi:hypothetical protein